MSSSYRVSFFLFLSFTASRGYYNESLVTSDLDLLDNLLKTYDRRTLPATHLGKPTIVNCDIYIRSFGSINPANMDYEVDLYLHQTWHDERLRNPTFSRPMDLNDPNLVKKIWKPEVFFANAKHAEFQYVTVPNILVRINPDGKILYMLRLKLRFSCMMDLIRYPLDSQVCAIELASFSKTVEELQLKWSGKNPIVLYPDIKLPQFKIGNVNTSLCSEKFHIGEYSCLKAEFHMQRSLGFHLVQSYLPTTLIVVVSWISFWLDVEAIPARVTLGVTTLLTISSKGSSIQSNLPPVSYVKAMDVWMGACTTFVFIALLEFTLVSYLWKSAPPGNALTIAIVQIEKKVTVSTIEMSELVDSCGEPIFFRDKSKASRIDNVSRRVFPALFILFNAIYWTYYTI